MWIQCFHWTETKWTLSQKELLTWSFLWISYTGGLFFLHLHLLVVHSFFPRCSTLHGETRSWGLRLSLRRKESKHPVYLSQREAGWPKSRHMRKKKNVMLRRGAITDFRLDRKATLLFSRDRICFGSPPRKIFFILLWHAALDDRCCTKQAWPRSLS